MVTLSPPAISQSRGPPGQTTVDALSSPPTTTMDTTLMDARVRGILKGGARSNKGLEGDTIPRMGSRGIWLVRTARIARTLRRTGVSSVGAGMGRTRTASCFGAWASMGLLIESRKSSLVAGRHETFLSVLEFVRGGGHCSLEGNSFGVAEAESLAVSSKK